MLESLFNKVAGPQAQLFSCQISTIFKNTFFKEHLWSLLLYILYTHDVTCIVSRWNNGCNGNYKKDQKKLKHFEKIVFWNIFYKIFHFLSLCVFISIQNIDRCIPLTCILIKKLISNCIIFETNNYICRNGYLRGCWL